MRRARRYVIRGRVQGVGFRYFAVDAAAREDIHGFARNLGDGTVEIGAEGEVEALERFERAIRRGPRGSFVDEVEVEDVMPSGRDTGFSIR